MVDDNKENSLEFEKNVLSYLEQYGKLIWPKFYGNGVYFRKHGKSNQIGFYLSLSLIIIPVGFGVYLYVLKPSTFSLIFAIFIIFLAVCGNTYSIYRHIKLERSAVSIMNQNGEFDWDMYENGILVKDYSENHPRIVERGFIRFEDLSKVYINIDDKNVQQIMDSMKKADLKKPNYIDDDYIATKDLVKYYKNEVHFIDLNGCLLDDEMYKENIDDISRFESIIRQKVNDVE